VEFAGLTLPDALAGHPLKPEPIKPLSHEPQLDDEIAGQVRWLGLTPLLLPQPDQGVLVAAHDDPGV
jgi:hypothetical protein